MKLIITMIALLCLPMQAFAAKLEPNFPFYPSESIKRDDSGNVWRESGNTYRINRDGTGNFGRWLIDCKKDAMDDARRCSLANLDYRIAVFYDASGNADEICVLGHDFPGETGAIRFDAEPALATDKTGCIAGAYVQKLRTSSKLTTRAVKFPVKMNVDTPSYINNFIEAERFTLHIANHIKDMKF